MKNLKFFIVLITLMFSIGVTLQAQECFTMEVVESFANNQYYYDITIVNNQATKVDIYDNDSEGYYETCPAQLTCYYTWSYNKPNCGVEYEVEITCEVKGFMLLDSSCLRKDGCVVIIDGGRCPPPPSTEY